MKPYDKKLTGINTGFSAALRVELSKLQENEIFYGGRYGYLSIKFNSRYSTLYSIIRKMVSRKELVWVKSEKNPKGGFDLQWYKVGKLLLSKEQQKAEKLKAERLLAEREKAVARYKPSAFGMWGDILGVTK